MRIVKISRGSRRVIATGSRKKMNDKLKQLRKSTRNGICGFGGVYKVKYVLEEEETDKETKNG